MNYEKMIAVNRKESEQKIKLATMAIEQLIERGGISIGNSAGEKNWLIERVLLQKSRSEK